MKKIDLGTIQIILVKNSPLPVQTAARELVGWFQDNFKVQIPVHEGPSANVSGTFQIILGTLNQPEIQDRVKQYQLPDTIRNDGYILALRENILLIYASFPRAVVYACGYELPLHASMQGAQLALDIDLIQEEPADKLRGWEFWTANAAYIPHAACKDRLNFVWLSSQISAEVELSNDARFASYIEPYHAEAIQLRDVTQKYVKLANAYGMDVFIGNLNSPWQLPNYLYEGLIHTYPETIAPSYQGGNQWPPYEWQDRPQLCLSSPTTRKFFTDVLDEYMALYPDAAGLGLGVGYDGYPFGCGCEKCKNYAYADRFRDQIMLVYDVVVKKYHKKLLFWSWAVAGASSIPGYEHYYAWVKDFAQANPESVIITSFATEGDYNITHRLNPVIGTRGPQDMGTVLIWPEYRGDGMVPAWIVDWMAESFPTYRAQGASGFIGADIDSDYTERNVLEGAEHYAFGQFSWHANKSAEQVATEYCVARFGEKAAPILQAALRRSFDVVAKTLYLPSGPRFSGHSNYEDDLRIMWEVYTLSDSGPFFLSQEQRDEILQAGPPYPSKVEGALLGLAFTAENIARVTRSKDEAVAEAEWMITQLDEVRPYLDVEMYEQLHTRLGWLRDYARIFRGLVRAFFHLRHGRKSDALHIRAGAEEMQSAIASLPQNGAPYPYGLKPHFPAYPWMVQPPFELIESLKAVAQMVERGIHQHPIYIWGSEEAAADLASLYVPYEVGSSLPEDLAHYTAIVLGPATMRDLANNQAGKRLKKYIKAGGRILLYNPSPNWESIPTTWLPGKVQSWVCNHPTVKVSQPDHPIVQGYLDLGARPITHFKATSAGVEEASRYTPFISSFVAVSSEWKGLTHPAALAEIGIGKGRIVIDLIPENRTVLLRCLAYLSL